MKRILCPKCRKPIGAKDHEGRFDANVLLWNKKAKLEITLENRCNLICSN